jgi:two-component system, OmpR family, sensor kinase
MTSEVALDPPPPPLPRRAAWARRLLPHPAGWTLRRRLVLSVVGLLALTSIIIGTVSVLALQGFLVGRLDSQLTATTGRSRQIVGEGPEVPQTPGFLTLPGQRPGMLGAVITDGAVFAGVLEASGVEKPLSASQVSQFLSVAPDGKPVTVSLGGSLGDYRVAVNQIRSNVFLVTGLPMGDVQATLLQLVVVIAIVTAAALALAAVGGTAIVRLALRPLSRVIATASHVAELPLDRGEVALAVRVPDADANPSTEVGKVGAAINRMLEHVAAAFTARQTSESKVRQFVADASHELRTPLASIRGYAELTRRGDYVLPDDVVHSIGRVESEAVRMTSLVEDLLLLARLDEGRDTQRAPVDLAPLLVDAVSDAHAAGGEHEWHLDVPDAPVVVSGDATRLHQVVTNLLANARIHTPAGTRVTVTLGRGEADTAVITVADNGPGIPDETKAVLFERFARGERSRSRAAGSTGLGLAIVRAVVASHGGTVSVTSQPGDTVFRVELPLAAAGR